jgi:hypothetical protein
MSKEHPEGREGQKNIDCEHYIGCLTYAARQNWRTFNCESCDLFKMKPKEEVEASKMNDKKLCEKCGKKPPINRFSKYCSGCLNSFKKDKVKGPGASKKKKKGHGKHKPEKAPKRANTALTIEFGKYASILQEVEKLADEEMRPLDLQIAYMLKSQLKAR